MSQVYFMAHQSVFSGVAAAGEVMQSIMKRFGLREGAKEWGKYVAQQVRTFKAFKSDSKEGYKGIFFTLVVSHFFYIP